MEGNEVSDSIFEEPKGGTHLSEEDKEGLIPSYISTRAELNQAEQENITKAQIWAFAKKRDPLDVDFLRKLHKRMLGDVWKWAGTFRKTERNIGIDPLQIQVQLRQLIDDTRYHIDHNTYPPEEIAARFHHRLVYIHPFSNGNGRHSRMTTDILLEYMGQERFTWGAGDLETKGEIRDRYIASLKAADEHDFAQLISFVRSGTD
jgi:Fic-DOC domain mobile mystery protein B